MTVMLSFLLPEHVSLSTKVPVQLTAVWHTFDRVGLGELCQIRDERFGDVLPRLALPQPQVNMRTGKLVHMKLEKPNKQVRLMMGVSQKYGSLSYPAAL